jgi:periplasmic copper chaperone A
MKSYFIVLMTLLAMNLAGAHAAEINVSSAWVRPTVPGQNIAGGYLKITSAETAYLVGGTSPMAKAVELHQMSLENNVMKMRPVARLELPAGMPVELKPGSYHLMLIDIARPLVAGDRVPLKLTVEDKGGKRHTVDVIAAVGQQASEGALPAKN